MSFRRRATCAKPHRPTMILASPSRCSFGFFAQERLDLVKWHDKQLRVSGELERIEPLVITSKPGKLTQAPRTHLVMSAFLCWRQIWIRIHVL